MHCHIALLLKSAIAQLAFIIKIGLKLAVQALRVSAHFESVCGCFVIDIDLGDAVGGGGLDHELDLAGALHECVQVGGLVDSASDSLGRSVACAKGAWSTLTSNPWFRRIRPFPLGPREAASLLPSSSLKTMPPNSG